MGIFKAINDIAKSVSATADSVTSLAKSAKNAASKLEVDTAANLVESMQLANVNLQSRIYKAVAEAEAELEASKKGLTPDQLAKADKIASNAVDMLEQLTSRIGE